MQNLIAILCNLTIHLCLYSFISLNHQEYWISRQMSLGSKAKLSGKKAVTRSPTIRYLTFYSAQSNSQTFLRTDANYQADEASYCKHEKKFGDWLRSAQEQLQVPHEANCTLSTSWPTIWHFLLLSQGSTLVHPGKLAHWVVFIFFHHGTVESLNTHITWLCP